MVVAEIRRLDTTGRGTNPSERNDVWSCEEADNSNCGCSHAGTRPQPWGIPLVTTAALESALAFREGRLRTVQPHLKSLIGTAPGSLDQAGRLQVEHSPPRDRERDGYSETPQERAGRLPLAHRVADREPSGDPSADNRSPGHHDLRDSDEIRTRGTTYVWSIQAAGRCPQSGQEPDDERRDHTHARE